MAVVRYNDEEVKLLARLMRAEAEGEGQMGMLLVGNVAINSITKMVYQRPGGFESTLYSYFYQPARSVDIKLAKRCIAGERFSPASKALWFYATNTGCQAKWWGQWNTGKYKSHCFYAPLDSENCY